MAQLGRGRRGRGGGGGRIEEKKWLRDRRRLSAVRCRDAYGEHRRRLSLLKASAAAVATFAKATASRERDRDGREGMRRDEARDVEVAVRRRR